MLRHIITVVTVALMNFFTKIADIFNRFGPAYLDLYGDRMRSWTQTKMAELKTARSRL